MTGGVKAAATGLPRDLYRSAGSMGLTGEGLIRDRMTVPKRLLVRQEGLVIEGFPDTNQG